MTEFYKGFVFEQDRPDRFRGEKGAHLLTIEGVPIKVIESATGKRFRATMPTPSGEREFGRQTIRGLAHCYIDRSGILRYRQRVTEEHLEWLTSKDRWNQCRREHPGARPMFAFVDLGQRFKGHSFEEYDFSFANFTEAKLGGLHFKNANFHQAILAKADLRGANLEGANFCRTDMYETNLSRASLKGANLQAALMVKTNLMNADLTNCQVYGLSAWDLIGNAKQQRGLEVRYKFFTADYEPHARKKARHRSFNAPHEFRSREETVYVDGLDMAGFIYLTIHNDNISRILSAAGRQWVLLLGSFTRDHKALGAIKEDLKKEGLIPIIFDFLPPDRRDLIETIVLLGGMSRFIIVEMTHPRSVPMELQAIVPNFGVPVIPVKKRSAKEIPTFSGLKKFPWLQKTIEYDCPREVIDHLKTHHSRLLSSKS